MRRPQIGRFKFALLCAGLQLVLAVPALRAQIVPGQTPQTATIRVNAAHRAAFTIPRSIFGSFLEPIGNSINNGLWAELLQNPSFEGNPWSASAIARMIQDEPSLSRASQLALPLPWEPLDASEGNRYEPRYGDAANSWRSLAIFGVPNKPTGIRQSIFLPVGRELQYSGSIYLKHLSGPSRIELSIRRHDRPEEVLSRVDLDASGPRWRKYSFKLNLKPNQLALREPADFVIQVQGDERVVVDQVSLMPDDALDGLDPEMVEMARAMKTPVVRFGGNFTSGYHWRDGIGPRDKRATMINVAWGIPEYNQFGTDEFLHFCKLIGAEPQIALNLGSGTPQEAADWVNYVNRHWTERSGGLLWELGNELWGNWNLAYPTLEELPARTLRFSEAVRQVDPHARLIATGQDPDVYQKWNAAQLQNPARAFNYLSTHFVVTTDRTVSGDRSPDFLAQAAFALPVELGRKIEAMQKQINVHPAFRDKAHIAFTEWLYVCCGGGNADAPRFDNMGGAIGAAGFFNMLMQHADVVPISDMTGIIEFAGIWKKRGVVYGTPSYYAFRLYSTADTSVPVVASTDAGTYDVHKGITRLPEIADVPYLDVVAALNKSGDGLTLFCINRHLTRDVPAKISIEGFTPAGNARIETLHAGSLYEGNTDTRPKAIAPVVSTLTTGGAQLEWTFVHESISRIELHSR
jgi:alpha-N-arabinofuranosidase